MSEPTYNLTLDKFTKNMNYAKEITLKALLKEKIITKAQFEKLNSGLIIIPCRKDNFGSAFAKIFGEPKEEGYLDYKVAKAVDINNIEEEVDKKDSKEDNRFTDI